MSRVRSGLARNLISSADTRGTLRWAARNPARNRPLITTVCLLNRSLELGGNMVDAELLGGLILLGGEKALEVLRQFPFVACYRPPEPVASSLWARPNQVSQPEAVM